MLYNCDLISFQINFKHNYMEFFMLKRILLSLFVIYAIFGFLILPYILKSQIIKNVELQTNAKIKIDSIHFNPFNFKLTINQLELSDIKNKTLFSLNLFEVNLEPHSLLKSSLHLKEIKLQNPTVFVVYDKHKQINFTKLLKQTKNDAKDSDSSLPRIIVDKINIDNGSIFYEDYSKGSKFETSLNNLDFNLNDLDTKDLLKSDTKLKLSCELKNKGLFKIQTNILSLEPLKLNGSITIKSAKLYTEYEYIKNYLNIEIADGELSLDTNFFINLNDLSQTKLDNLTTTISKLRIKPKKEHQDILTLKSFKIEDATIHPFENDVNIENIILNNLYTNIEMDKNGEINWIKYIKTNFKDKNSSKAKEDTKSKKWNVTVKDIALKEIHGEFKDKSIFPSVLTKLNTLDIKMQNVTLLGEKPFSYEMQLLVNDAFKCNSKGIIKHNTLDISSTLKCSEFDIVHYKPYIDKLAKENLQKYDLDLKRANLGFDVVVNIRDENSTVFTYIDDANVNFTNFQLNKKSTKENLASFKNLSISNIKLNTKLKDIKIAKTSLEYLTINPKRYSNGSLNIENLVIPKKIKTKLVKKSKKTDNNDYKIELKSFLVKSANINFRDLTLKPNIKTKLRNIDIKLSDINSKKLNWMKYNINARLNKNGYIKSYGKLKLSPLRKKGRFELKNIKLKDFSPYIEDKAYIKLDNGILSLKSKFNNEKLDGSLKLSKLFFNDTRDNSSIFAVNKLNINSFNLTPKKLFIDAVELNSFYLNAIIAKDKTINFSKLMKKTVEIDDNKTNLKKNGQDKFSVLVLQTYIKNGNASFSDHSLPIEFSTQIHDVNGMIYALSTAGTDTSYMDITGEVDAYGSTKLKGSVSIADAKKYTDLDFNFRNLNLNSVTGYSAKFAGHEIDDGKLFLNLHYDIKNSKLQSSNSIIVKHIKLGKEYQDKNTTSLPLGFVISLLEDTDGVIDIDMPIDGDVDKPNFKYGSLLMKTFFKLIGNAITSPFRFLGSTMGIDGDKLSFVEYEIGKSSLIPSEKEKLDNLAKIMLKKPKISIAISGVYNSKTDKFQLQKQKLIKKLHTQIEIMPIEDIEDIYEELVTDSNLSDIKKQFKKEYKQALINLCINTQEITKKELLELANKRVNIIKNYLVIEKLIDFNRINIKDIIISDKTETDFIRIKLNMEM